MDWSRQSIPGTVESNWNRIETFLNRLNAFDASATKVVEGQDGSGTTITTVIFPVRTIPVADIKLGD